MPETQGVWLETLGMVSSDDVQGSDTLMRSAEETLSALGIVLPPTHAPAANYVPWTTVGDLLFLAGHGPRSEDGKWRLGKLGETVSFEEGLPVCPPYGG